jgi:DMSO/TMAO reductase YedYZ molybdopterin-dependent catalytic subunit
MSGPTRGFFGRRRSGHAAELPPGQYDTGRSWPVLSAEVTPRLDLSTWTFTVDGLVDREVTWTWDEIHALPPAAYEGAIHCVTTWSKFDTNFAGVFWERNGYHDRGDPWLEQRYQGD